MTYDKGIKGAVESTGNDILNKAQGALNKGADMAGKAESKISDGKDAALSEINTMITALNDKIAALGLDAEKLTDKAKASYADVEGYITREVSERPLRTLAFVGLTGLVLGMISRK